MRNTLPEASTSKYVRNRFSDWNVKDADPKCGRISSSLIPEFSEAPNTTTQFRINKPPTSEPNHRLNQTVLSEDFSSPLCELNRGSADQIAIRYKVTAQSEVKQQNESNCVNERFLVLKLTSSLTSGMDLFVQAQSLMRSHTVDPYGQCLRSVRRIIPSYIL